MPAVGIGKMIITGPIESFFQDPSSEPSPEGDGILFHLRRDLVMLYGAEHEYTRDVSPHPILTLMGILAGIDYLSKTYSAEQGSRKRFVETIRDLCKITQEDSEAIYQFRCALIHSVALSTISACAHRRGTRFNFEITDDRSCPLIEKLSDDNSEVRYRICFWRVKAAFMEAIENLERIARDVSHNRNPRVINMIGQMHSEKILNK
jgi:hypothetical protein